MWSLGLCQEYSHLSQQNEAQKQTRNFYSLLTVQFNVPQKCYEFKPNTELIKDMCKCYEHTLVCYFS